MGFYFHGTQKTVLQIDAGMQVPLSIPQLILPLDVPHVLLSALLRSNAEGEARDDRAHPPLQTRRAQLSLGTAGRTRQLRY